MSKIADKLPKGYATVTEYNIFEFTVRIILDRLYRLAQIDVVKFVKDAIKTAPDKLQDVL